MNPNDSHARRWKFAALAALPVLALALAPQIFFRLARGGDWRGEFAHTHSDEVAYAAYTNALLDGRPRRSDPYTGRDDAPAAPARENIFSVQFAPPLALAAAGKLLRLDTARLFVALTCLAALSAALALYWLLTLLVGDDRAAAAGTLAVLCLASSYRVIEHLLKLSRGVDFLPFLRRYQPAAAFPLLFVFVALVWLMLTRRRALSRHLAACGAGAALALLVFSYFYLWTAAAAWLSVLAALWLSFKPAGRRRSLAPFAVVFAFLAAALVPYFLLLANRGALTDASQLLAATRMPDLLRVPVIVGALALAALYGGVRRGLISSSDPAALFAAACALMPAVVFNQQVLTGRSLQPVHYSLFSANYFATLGAFLCAVALVRAGRASRPIPAGWLLALAAVSLASGAAETALACRVRLAGNVLRDEARPAARRLAELGHATPAGTPDTTSVVFTPDYTVADYLPTVAPQPALWAPHTINSALTQAEHRERLAHFLYYSGADFSGVDPRGFDALDGRSRFLVSSLMGFGRLSPELNANWRPVAPAEIEAALRDYEAFVSSYTSERAASLPLAYVLADAAGGVDLKNLDRWYERDAGERHGRFILYRVRLK